MSFGTSRSRTTQGVDPAQQPALGAIYSQVSELLGEQTGPIEAAATRISQRYSPGLAAAADTASGIASGSNPAVQALLARAGGENPALGGVIDSTREDLLEQFEEDILPAIGGGAELAGARGSSRQGVAEGVAARGLTRELGDVSSALRFDDYVAGGAAAVQAGQLQLGGAQAAGGIASQALNLGLAPYSAAFQPALLAAQATGSPTVLGQSRSRGLQFAL